MKFPIACLSAIVYKLPFVAWAILLSSISGPLRAATVVDTNDHRPLAAALATLQPALGIAINYEDVPYENQQDLDDVSTPQQRALYPGYRLLVPRKGHVTATILSSAASSEGEKVFDLNVLLNSYRTNGMPGDFVVEQANAMLYVVATRVRTAAGPTRDVASPMRTAITIPYAERTIADTLVAIAQSISSSSGAKIAVGRLPFHPKQTVGFGVTRQVARDALASLFAKLTTSGVSYQLLFDPVAGYMLNVDVIASGDIVPAPEEPPKPEGTEPNRFFTRN